VERRISKITLGYSWEHQYKDCSTSSFASPWDDLRTLDALIDPPKYLPEDSEYGCLKDLIYLRKWIVREEEALVRKWIRNESLRLKVEEKMGSAEWKAERERIRASVEEGYDFWIMHIPLITPLPGLGRWSFERVDWLDVHGDKGTMPWGATRRNGYLGGQGSDITGTVFLTDNPANDGLVVPGLQTDGVPMRTEESPLSAELPTFGARVEEAHGSKGSSGYKGSVESNASTSGAKDSADANASELLKKSKKRRNKGKGKGKGKGKIASSAAATLGSAALTDSSPSAGATPTTSDTPSTSTAATATPPPNGSVCSTLPRPTTSPPLAPFTPHPGTATHGRPDEKYRRCPGNHPPTIVCTSCYTRTRIEHLEAIDVWATREYGKNPWEFVGFSETTPNSGVMGMATGRGEQPWNNRGRGRGVGRGHGRGLGRGLA